MEKYLPIGTICTLNSTNKKYVIAGYFSLEYSYDIKMHDYVGIPYPEGLLSHNKTISFNHDDIIKIDFLGFSDENFEKFNQKLTNQSEEVESLEENNGIFDNFKFDENGFVIYEYTIDSETDSIDNNFGYQEKELSEYVENPFNKKHNFINQSDQIENSEEPWTVFKEYSFDENGTLISEETVEKSEDTDNETYEKIYVDDDIVFVKNDSYNQLVFDKEGTVLIVEEEIKKEFVEEKTE